MYYSLAFVKQPQLNMATKCSHAAFRHLLRARTRPSLLRQRHLFQVRQASSLLARSATGKIWSFSVSAICVIVGAGANHYFRKREEQDSELELELELELEQEHDNIEYASRAQMLNVSLAEILTPLPSDNDIGRDGNRRQLEG